MAPGMKVTFRGVDGSFTPQVQQQQQDDDDAKHKQQQGEGIAASCSKKPVLLVAGGIGSCLHVHCNTKSSSCVVHTNLSTCVLHRLRSLCCCPLLLACRFWAFHLKDILAVSVL